MTTLAEDCKRLAGYYEPTSSISSTLLKAAEALQRAQLDHYATEARDMLHSLQEADVSVGYACQWLRKYILDGLIDDYPKGISL